MIEIGEVGKELQHCFDELSLEISSKLDAERPERDPSNRSKYNYASELPHPCKKHLVHSRVDWRERQIMDIDGRWRTEEGKDKEWAAKKWFGDVGFVVKGSERYFNTDDPGLEQYKSLQISGRIDGLIEVRKKLPEPFSEFKELPIEIKSISPHYWQSTRTVEDLKRHSKFWIQKIPSQLNIYFVFRGWPGGLLVLVTFGKKPRILPMIFDENLWNINSKMALSVNEHVEKGTYPPPMPFDATVCGMCDFNHICTPLKPTSVTTELSDSDKFELELYLETKEQNEHFKRMHAELIGTNKKPGKYFGQSAFIEDIEIKTNSYMKKKYEVPEKEKEKYRVEDQEIITTKIERIEP